MGIFICIYLPPMVFLAGEKRYHWLFFGILTAGQLHSVHRIFYSPISALVCLYGSHLLLLLLHEQRRLLQIYKNVYYWNDFIPYYLHDISKWSAITSNCFSERQYLCRFGSFCLFCRYTYQCSS